jgi:hypothetical protein
MGTDDGQTDMVKLIGAVLQLFVANASKNDCLERDSNLLFQSSSDAGPNALKSAAVEIGLVIFFFRKINSKVLPNCVDCTWVVRCTAVSSTEDACL